MEVMLFMMVQKVVKSFQKLPIFQKISKYYPEVNSYLIFFFVNKSRKYVVHCSNFQIIFRIMGFFWGGGFLQIFII